MTFWRVALWFVSIFVVIVGLFVALFWLVNFRHP